MKTHKNIKGHRTPAREPSWCNYLTFALAIMVGFSLLLIPSCMQAQSQEVTIISNGEQHER